VIFGRRISKHYPGKLQTEIEDLHLGNPVMRSYYKNGFAEHYVRDHDVLRFEAAGNDMKGDYGINKAVENLVPPARKTAGYHRALSECAAGYLGDLSQSRRAPKVGNQLCDPMANGFPDSNWIMPDNWP
jgi:hypothetical protein